MGCYNFLLIFGLLSISERLVVASNGGQVFLYALSNLRGFAHRTEATLSCENLPEAFWRKASYIRTDACVSLYSNSDCVGDEVRIEADVDENLSAYQFDNTAISLRSCDHENSENVVGNRRIQFYNHDNYRDLLLDTEIDSACANIPCYHRNMAASVKTDVCVIIYSNANCTVNSLRLEAGNYPVLPDFDEEADSYKPCDAN